jgi:hypothetical protein
MGDTDPPPPTPAGWYPDPAGQPGLRYFDGQRWTDHRHAAEAIGVAHPGGAPKRGALPTRSLRWAGVPVVVVVGTSALTAHHSNPANSSANLPTVKTVSPTQSAPAAPPSPVDQGPPMHTKVVDLTLPPGSVPDNGNSPGGPAPTTDDASSQIEYWTVPLSVSDEIANLRPQLPINSPLDGLNYCGDDANIKDGDTHWTWSSGPQSIEVGVEAGSGNTTWGGSKPRVLVERSYDSTDNGCGDQSIVEDGTFTVGTDIQPGTYHTEGGEGCYWARLSGFGGTVGDVIANHLGSGPQTVTISQSDKAFNTARCGIWQKQ